MRLHGSLRSPYVRKCRIVAIENGIDLPMDIHSVLDPDTPPPSPLLRIPSLQLDDGRLLVDSRVICEHLNSVFARDLDDYNLEAIGDGIMDRSVSRFLMQREETRFHSPTQLNRWESAIFRTLDALTVSDDQFGIGEISLICALGYLDLRHSDLNWRKGRQELADWYERLLDRPSIKQTEPPQ